MSAMDHTATAGSIDSAIIEEALMSPPEEAPATPVHEILDQMPSEHISMGGEEEDQTVSEPLPGDILERLQLVNRVRGLRTELILFEGAFLKVREYHKKKMTKDHLLNLRYLSPKPTLTRHVAMKVLQVALGLSGVAAVSWLLAEFTSLARFFMPSAVVFGTAALVTFMLFVYRTQERIRFCTAHGDVEVLSLLATFGCFRRARKLVPEVARAIADATGERLENRAQHLRAEIQEHYRLRDSGVILREDCADSTRKILASFG